MPQINANTNRTAGFSLVEVLCAILILGVGLVGITRGMTSALLSSKESELQTTAALLAAGRIETLRAEGYLLEGEKEGHPGDGDSLYEWRQSIRSAPIEGLYEVTVTVSHTRTKEPIYQLRTLLFDAPYYQPVEEDEENNSRDLRNRERQP